ncbi:hypothetical protein Ae168Ps1_4857c [Pseudonocardia sp. Ae168_Ps1]|nr:hypothetical protein Ae150APs1_4819c [Pseudonocardia sp. Ae150A_Ps1]OLL82451.1 hypothetical protein Ae168Ps1_4857c [Pseudonocardia sp. Ae168_Ps1]OLL83434.1 hypothetical protein Ae263Ps1_0489 [Pseudonocardia sp. Ae263_Ps1]OLL90526.1 hypothetical protein Ae356Ps1_0423c [Pseudonocardia sp. Ae356_Ps1]
MPSPRAGRSASAAVPASTLLQEPVTASGRHRARRAGDGDDTGAAEADSPTGVTRSGRSAEVRVSRSPWADPDADDASGWAPGAPARSATTTLDPPAVPDAPVELFSHREAGDEPDDGAHGARHAARGTSGVAIAELHEPAGPADAGTGAGDSSVVEIDRAAPAGRSRLRRYGPLGVGVAAILAATLVVTLLQPGAEDPSLSTTLVDASRRSVSDGVGTATTGIGDGGGSAMGDVAQGASGQIGPAIAAAEAAEWRAAERKAAAERAAESGSDSGSGTGSAPAGPVGGAAQVVGDGIQAALKLGWQAIGGDEFTGSSLGENWSAYDGAGHDGQGRRTPDAVSVENGNLVIRGDSEGNTGGIAWGTPQKYGKWEMRAKFPKGDEQYHPVLLLWPSEISWPEGGEVDFAETTSASEDVSFFLHYGSDNSQKHAKTDLDITQWNNYAVEWTPEAIVGYVNGVEFFRSTDPETLPPGPMHATVQLDYFPSGGSPQPSEMQVAWMRQYS